MSNSIEKRGQKFLRKFSRASLKASEEGREHIKENLIDRFSHIADIRLLILEWSLLVIALVMLAITQSFWFGNSYAENVFVGGGTYTEATLGEVNSLNPLFAVTSSEKTLSRLMFATLSTIDNSGHSGIGLADSIKSSDDGKTWTIKLRNGLKWSDGEPITNEDVMFTIDLIKNPAVGSVYNSNLANIKVSEKETGEIIFTLPTTYSGFITNLNIPIVPKHVLGEVDPRTLLENNFSSSPVTSGAFNFNAMQINSNSPESEKVFYLSANPDYYKGQPMLNSFAIHTYGSKDGIIAALNSGAVTATAELSGAEADKINTAQFILKNSSINSGAFIFFNTSSEAVKSRGMRTAIRQGINLAKVREAAPGTTPLDYPLLKEQIELTNYPSVPGYDYTKSKEKIAEFLAKQPVSINIATVNSGFLPSVTESVKTELENLGLEVHVTTYDENQDFINNVISKRSYDILIYEIELGADADLLPYYHSSQANASGLNLSNYRNTLADDSLLGARDALSRELKIKKLETFLDYWITDVPAIGLYRSNLAYYYNKNVRTFGNDVRLVTSLDRFSDINSWATTKATKNKTP